MRAKKSVSMKAVVIMMVLVLLFGCGVDGTLAYLIAAPKSVTNTFVAGKIGELTLKETKGNSFTVVPGVDIEKDPKVSFSGHNVDAYVFVKVENVGTGEGCWHRTNEMKYSNVVDRVSWNVDAEWIYLTEEDNAIVYYREVSESDNLTDASIISGDKITVSSEITKENLTVDPCETLTFTAYAIQKDGFEGNVVNAWNAVKDTAVTSNP